MKSRRCAREAALQALYQCDTLEDWSEECVERYFQVFRAEDLAKKDEVSEEQQTEHCQEVFARALIDGVAIHLEQLDALIASASTHWTLPRMARVDRNILRIATYEMGFMDDIPCSVSINEAIEIAKRFGSDESPTFVNGVLDRLAHLLAERGEGPEIPAVLQGFPRKKLVVNQ